MNLLIAAAIAVPFVLLALGTITAVLAPRPPRPQMPANPTAAVNSSRKSPRRAVNP